MPQVIEEKRSIRKNRQAGLSSANPSMTMLHVEQKKTPGKIPGVVRFHVEQRRCQRRSGITTWRDFSLLDSRTSAEELESRSWMMTSSSRRADRASSR